MTDQPQVPDCVIPACGATAVRARGLCGTHYSYMRERGRLDEFPLMRPTLDERLWRDVLKTPTCWLWTGAKQNGGYGVVYTEDRRKLAHRVVYELLVGPIPPGLQIDHLCRVRHCVNPNHLEPVTPRENTLRGEGRAGQRARQTHCIHGHPFTPENTKIEATGYRSCRTCKRASYARYRIRRKEAS